MAEETERCKATSDDGDCVLPKGHCGPHQTTDEGLFGETMLCGHSRSAVVGKTTLYCSECAKEAAE